MWVNSPLFSHFNDHFLNHPSALKPRYGTQVRTITLDGKASSLSRKSRASDLAKCGEFAKTDLDLDLDLGYIYTYIYTYTHFIMRVGLCMCCRWSETTVGNLSEISPHTGEKPKVHRWTLWDPFGSSNQVAVCQRKVHNSTLPPAVPWLRATPWQNELLGGGFHSAIWAIQNAIVGYESGLYFLVYWRFR